MNIFQFFRKKDPTKAPQIQFVFLSPYEPMPESRDLSFFRPPELRRLLAEKEFQKCLEDLRNAICACYESDKKLADALIAEALSKTDDDDTANNSTLNTPN